MQPLEGVKVVDLTRLLPGPYLTQVLVDLGASVVKLEDPGSPDPMRAWPARYAELNRGKRCLALDLKDPRGLAAARAVIERADVLVEGFRPGVLERLGLGPDTLPRRLIVARLSGFGQSGPLAARAGHDLGYQALAGTLGLTGGMPGAQVADLGGALWALAGITSALYAQATRGQGACIDVSLTEAALAFASGDVVEQAAGERDFLHGGLANYRRYPCGDGLELAVGALEPRFWLAFNQAIGRAGTAEELAAVDHEPIARQILAILGTAPRGVWLERLAGVDCCVEPVLTLAEVAQLPLHQARQALGRSPIAPRTGGEAAALGAHSREVLLEVGLTPDAVAALEAGR